MKYHDAFSDKMKKVFSAALCLLMLVQLLPVHVHAETATDNVAKVTMSGAETYYEKLTDAVKAVKDAAAAGIRSSLRTAMHGSVQSTSAEHLQTERFELRKRSVTI